MGNCKHIVLFLFLSLLTIPACKEHHIDEIEDIHEAAANNNINRVKALLKENPSLVNAKDDSGWTPLHWAAEGGWIKIVEILITNGARVNETDEGGNTPLYIAACWGWDDVVGLLISNGADVNIKANGGTPLHAVANGGREEPGFTSRHIKVAEMLILNGANVNALDREGKTPLKITQERNIVELIDLLRKHGAHE